jgi:predicted amidophosphoribosyltransferase
LEVVVFGSPTFADREMAIVNINPMKLSGPWRYGYVLDYHSVSATPTGDPYHPFEMKYTELGGRLYRFKYRGDKSVVMDIVDTAEQFIKGFNMTFDCVVPAPPSMRRASQPVVELATELAKRLNVPACEDALAKVKETPPMKNIPDWLERQKLLGEAVQVGGGNVKGKTVLLPDDLVESGSTLRRAADALLKDGGAAVVCAIGLTRTR